VLRRTFGPKRKKVTGSWRKLHNEELHYLYSFSKYYYDDQIKEDACSIDVRDEKLVQGFGYKTCKEETTKCRWEDNIKMGHKGIGWEGVGWIHLAWDRTL
jgi:hypothetical protein